MKKLAIFASGNGTNFEAIVQACEQRRINAGTVLMVCDRPGAYVVERAAKHNVESFVFKPSEYSSKAAYEKEIVRHLKEKSVDLVCLAGYMRMLSLDMLDAYEGRIINIHPALLPSFKGKNAIEQAFKYGVKVYGATIHYVDETMDGGKIISQRAFEYKGKSLATLEKKMHAVEHELYIDTINELLGQM